MDFHFISSTGSNDADEDRPVVVVTDEMMAALDEHERLHPRPTDENTLISPLGDESVQGYIDDEQAKNGGVQEILEVVKILEGAKIPCCMVEEPALIYYGAARFFLELIMCVPTEQLEKATAILDKLPDLVERFRPSAMKRVNGLEDFYPRYKFVGTALFFIIMSSQACHISCKPENIVHSESGIPYPRLPVYAQSLLDTMNWVDLHDLIDGMNLTIEWGEKYLNLDGTVDIDYGRWKADMLLGHKATEDKIPMWCQDPDKRRKIWLEAASTVAKKHRQGFKYHASCETRFWRRGRREDPRLYSQQPS